MQLTGSALAAADYNRFYNVMYITTNPFMLLTYRLYVASRVVISMKLDTNHRSG